MRIFCWLAFMAIFISCKKNNDPPPLRVDGEIQFKVNGQLVIMDNADTLSGAKVFITKQPKGILPDTRYLLTAQNSINNNLIVSIITDSLHKGAYSYDSAYMSTSGSATLAFSFNSEGAAICFNGDFIDIHITSYGNGRVSGAFTAKLTPVLSIPDYSQRNTIVITEGVINNIPVNY